METKAKVFSSLYLKLFQTHFREVAKIVDKISLMFPLFPLMLTPYVTIV